MALAALLIIGSAPAALAWGDRGHSIVAEIAQRHLEPDALVVVAQFLGGGASMASVSSWADDYKFTEEGKGTQPWHFIDIDNAHAGFMSADCQAGGCLVSALRKQAGVLGDAARPMGDRAKALLLLIHLVGDSTQLFHCGERNGDGGGNGVQVDFSGVGPDGKPRPVNGIRLHALWDETLIDDHAWNWGGYADTLYKTVAPGLPPASLDGDWAVAWIDECHVVSQAMYGLVPADAQVALGSAYQAQVQPVLDRQLATGGLRLAVLLYTALTGSNSE